MNNGATLQAPPDSEVVPADSIGCVSNSFRSSQDHNLMVLAHRFYVTVLARR